MPTYEYACSECGNQWEEVQRITAPALEVCPKCQKKSAHRQISGGNFILKGGGWYSDLYSSSPKKTETKDSSEAKTEAKGESKTEGKAEKKDSPAPATTASPGGSTPAPAAGSGSKT